MIIFLLYNYSTNVLLKHVIHSFGIPMNEMITAWKFIKFQKVSYNIMEISIHLKLIVLLLTEK